MTAFVPRCPALAALAARWFAACLALSAMAFPACAQTAPPWPGNGQADPIRPDPRLTPGGVATSDPGVFCHAGYSRSVRHTSGQVKRQVYRAYGIDRRSGSYEIDHLVPLAIGGSDEPANLWPQSFGTEPWNAGVKDRLEWRLVGLVCRGEVAAEQAQHDIATDWIAAYAKYCPASADCPGYAASHGGTE